MWKVHGRDGSHGLPGNCVRISLRLESPRRNCEYQVGAADQA